MNSPVDPALLQLVQQEVKLLQDNLKNVSVEFDQEKIRVQQELQNAAIILEEMKQTVERLNNFQGISNLFNLSRPFSYYWRHYCKNILVSCFFFTCGII